MISMRECSHHLLHFKIHFFHWTSTFLSDFPLKYIILTVVLHISYIPRFLFSFLNCLLINKNYVLYWFNYKREFIGI